MTKYALQNSVQLLCNHIYRISLTCRDKKCLKCGYWSRDFGIARKYKKI